MLQLLNASFSEYLQQSGHKIPCEGLLRPSPVLASAKSKLLAVRPTRISAGNFSCCAYDMSDVSFSSSSVRHILSIFSACRFRSAAAAAAATV